MGVDVEPRTVTSLRRYELALRRAKTDYEEARMALERATIELQKAEAVFEAANDMARAADADRTRDLRLDTVSPITLAWIQKLSSFAVAGTTEFHEAADEVGWKVTSAGIRQQVKRLTERGVLTKLSEGAYRVSDRAAEVLGDLLLVGASEAAAEHRDNADPARLHLPKSDCDSERDSERHSDVTEPIDGELRQQVRRGRPSSFDDELDDDLPF